MKKFFLAMTYNIRMIFNSNIEKRLPYVIGATYLIASIIIVYNLCMEFKIEVGEILISLGLLGIMGYILSIVLGWLFDFLSCFRELRDIYKKRKKELEDEERAELEKTKAGSDGE